MAIATDPVLAARVQSAIRNVSGFPRPENRVFRDVSPIVENDPDLFRAVIDAMTGFGKQNPPDCIAAIESWGFVFGAPIAYLLGSRLCLLRRPGKLPRQTAMQAYDMSYSNGRSLAIQGEAIGVGDRVLVVDDVLASGRTALAAVELVQQAGGQCIGVACLATFADWGAKLVAERGVPVHAVATL
jgi:adenine phosphoribosyltransferase